MNGDFLLSGFMGGGVGSFFLFGFKTTSSVDKMASFFFEGKYWESFVDILSDIFLSVFFIIATDLLTN